MPALLLPPPQQPAPKTSRRHVGGCAGRAIVLLAGSVRCRIRVETFFGVAVESPSFGDFVLRPVARPAHLAARNPVVGPAGETPVPDRGIEGHGGPIEGELPIGGGQRRYDLGPATAAALVHSRGIGDAHVQRALVEVGGDDVHELVSKHLLHAHGLSSLCSTFPSMA